MNLKQSIKPITYLKNNAAKVVKEISETGNELVITQNGEAKAVLMSVEQYDEWRETFAMLKLVAIGEAEIAAGKYVSQEEAFAHIDTLIDSLEEDEDE